MPENNLEDEIMGGIRFDENGLPIIEGATNENTPHLQKEKKIMLKPSEKFGNSYQSREPISKEPDEITAIKALIKKAKKFEKKFDISPVLSTIGNEMYNIIVQTYEEISEEEILKIMFDLTYNAEEIKDQIFKQFIETYRGEN